MESAKKKLKVKCILSGILSILLCMACDTGEKMSLTSPDSKVSVNVYLREGKLFYDVELENSPVLEASPLGITTKNSDFTKDLIFEDISELKEENQQYSLLRGKKSQVTQSYKEQMFNVKNKEGKQLGVIFRVSNDGVAYAYNIKGNGEEEVLSENSGFNFPEKTTAFMAPLAKAKSGWAKTNPSYEDHYQLDIPIGTPSDYGQGWVYPALFRIGDEGWVLISETGVDCNYVATHLADDSQGGLYKVEFPHADHNLPEDPATAAVTLPFTTPWRTITIGENLNTIVESTMAQDLVTPYYSPNGDYRSGKASWSWLVYNDGHTTYKDTKEFIDLADSLDFEYCLIDAIWDTQIGRDKIEELAKYAAVKNIGLILWYNSNGNWNDAPQSPLNRMNTRDARREELAWMQKIGIKGIKVDFFGGDKQSGMQLYQDILEDANDFGIACNFHGATLPRGWDRMFPNFVTAEAVMGMEFCKFDQKNADWQPKHCTILPFIRNVVAPMDFTPVVLNPNICEVPGTGAKRMTTAAFELALPVILYSPVEHFGIVPDNLKQFPQYVWNYLSKVPSTWDETLLIDGYPGKDVMMARRSGKIWYVAGINGEKIAKDFSCQLPFIQKETMAQLITDKSNTNNETEIRNMSIAENGEIQISIQPYGGFVLVINTDGEN